MTSNKKRVFITGYGSVDCLQQENDLATRMGELYSEVRAEPMLSRPISTIDEGIYSDDKVTRRMDRFTLMAYIAVRKALAHAAIVPSELASERIGIIMNTCFGPLDSTRHYISKLIRDGAKKVPAAVFPNTVHNAFTGRITMEIKVFGSNSTVSGQNPICYGLDMIREGHDDIMIVGGCDELLTAMTKGFGAAGLQNQALHEGGTNAGVYETKHNTFKLGEGAAVLVLESEASMRARGAKAYAEVLDYGMTNGLEGGPGAAFPADQIGLKAAMQQALDRAEISRTEVNFISSACNGLARLASAEMDAVSSIFGDDTQPLVSNIKSAIGETLGAASVFSTLLAVHALQAQSVAPVWDLAPGVLNARVVAGAVRHAAIEVALVNGIELGGTITSLALRKCADGGLLH
jgi:3-oxoacyl-[acyl-carrier-protein] synthase II